MRICLLAGLLAGLMSGAMASAQSRLDDAAAILEQREWAVEQAWAVLAEPSLPLVEPHPDDDNLARVTFAWRGDPTVTGVRLDSVVNAPYAAPVVSNYTRDFTLPMTRLEGSLIWSITLDVPRDVQASYSFLVESAGGTYRRTDPANPRRLQGRDGETLLMLDRIEQRDLLAPVAEDKTRQADALALDSVHLDRTVLLQLYRAPGAGPDAPVLVLYDAFLWGVREPAWEIVQNLADAGTIPPTHVVLIDQLDPESAAHAYADQGDFIARELLPFLRFRAGIAENRDGIIIAGASRRGLSAAITAMEHPAEIGGVLSLSGSFYWAPPGEEPEWFIRRLMPATIGLLRFHLAAGTLEYVHTSTNQGHVMLDTNRRLYAAMEDAGYRVSYDEFPGGHDVAAWRTGLADGLAELLGSGTD